jgi:hypothetical protein
MNTKKEEAIEKLLERRGYTIYDTVIYEHSIIIEGSVNHGYQYDFKVDIPFPIIIDEGKSTIDMIVEKIKEYTDEIDLYIKEFSKKKKLESNLREKTNKQLLNYMEDKIKNHYADTILTIHSSNFPRVSGKTSAILYLADKYDLPVLFNTREMEKIVNIDFPNIQTYNIFDLNKIPFGTILVDEVQTKYIDMLNYGNRKIIGLVK